MQIRLMCPEDYPAVDRMMACLHQRHVDNRPDLFVPMDAVYDREEFLQMLASDQWACLIAEEEGVPAGLCFAELRPRVGMRNVPAGYIHDIFVYPEFRRKGAATALFREAERLIREMGAARLDLMVWAFNEDALAFYRSLGMRPQRYFYELPLKEE